MGRELYTSVENVPALSTHFDRITEHRLIKLEKCAHLGNKWLLLSETGNCVPICGAKGRET
jgi:hypothetical protein